jgi:hypothetical protein
VIAVNKKVGFYSFKGREVISPTFDKYEVISRPGRERLIKVVSIAEDGTVRMGVMDLWTKMIVPQIYSSMDHLYSRVTTFQLISKGEDVQGVLKNYETVIIPAEFREVNVVDGLSTPFFRVANKNYDVALMDSAGRVIIPFGLATNDTYPDENSPSGGPYYFQVYSKKKNGFASSAKGVIIPPEYEYTESVQLGGKIYFPISKGKKRGLMDGDGKWILALEYQSIEPVELNNTVYSIVKKKGKFGIADVTGKLIVPADYGWIEPLGDSDPTGIFTLSDKEGQTFVLTKELKLVKSEE